MFKPGQSGNPAGRTVGTGKAAKLRAELEQHAPEAIAKLISLVKAGDPTALRLYFDRVLPALKPETAATVLPELKGSLTDQARAVLASAAAGDLPIDVAIDVVSAIAKLMAVEEGDELRRRLDAIEHGGIA